MLAGERVTYHPPRSSKRTRAGSLLLQTAALSLPRHKGEVTRQSDLVQRDFGPTGYRAAPRLQPRPWLLDEVLSVHHIPQVFGGQHRSPRGRHAAHLPTEGLQLNLHREHFPLEIGDGLRLGLVLYA